MEETKIIEIKDGMNLQAELPLEGGKDLGPSWDELSLLYQAMYPDVDFEEARLMLANSIWTFPTKEDPSLALAEIYFRWIGLSYLAWKERGLGQEKMVQGLRKLWRNVTKATER